MHAENFACNVTREKILKMRAILSKENSVKLKHHYSSDHENIYNSAAGYEICKNSLFKLPKALENFINFPDDSVTETESEVFRLPIPLTG